MLSVIIAEKFEDKEVHESSHRNRAQEETKKIEVVKSDRDEDKIFKCNKCKKLWRQRSTWNLTQKWNTGRNWKKNEVVELDRDKDKIFKCNKCKNLWRKNDMKFPTEIKHKKKSKNLKLWN